MKTYSKLNRKAVVLAAAVTLTILAGSLSAFAVPASQVHRSTTPITVSGPCCQNINGESVKITEPSLVAPVILVWSMEYVSTGPFAFGVSINGGGCGDYGPEWLPTETASNGTAFHPATFQLVIQPSDGLVSGTNTFQVCEGPTVNNSDQMTIGTRTLSVQISK